MHPTSSSSLPRRNLLFAGLALALAGCSVSPDALAVGRAVSIDIVDRDTGQLLEVYQHAGRSYVAGRPGARYAIRIGNRSGARVLAVTAVDGINILTGKTAAWGQSGYVLEPWQSYEVTGWRKSDSQVAAFEFTALPDSYAARTGRPLDVGVIGVAVFRDKTAPVAAYPLRDRFAATDMDRRKDAPAPSLESDRIPAQALASEAAAVGKTMRAPAAAAATPLATGHGRNETSYVTQVAFERATTAPAEVQTIQYDRRDNLIALGVLPTSRYAQRQPQAFPGLRFAPDPR